MNLQGTALNELAADIARRVRLYSWQPMPEALAEALGNYPWVFHNNYPMGPQQITLVTTYQPKPQRLDIEFRVNGNFGIGRFLWTPE